MQHSYADADTRNFAPNMLGAVFVKLKQQMPPLLGVLLNFVG